MNKLDSVSSVLLYLYDFYPFDAQTMTCNKASDISSLGSYFGGVKLASRCICFSN